LRCFGDRIGPGPMQIRKVISKRLHHEADGLDFKAAVDAVVAINVNDQGDQPDPDTEEASQHGRDEAPHP
jgi:hypothetical protein